MRRVENTNLGLRKFESKDVDQLYLFRNDQAVQRQLVGFSTGYSKHDLLTWIDFHRTQNDEVLWAVVDLDADICIGHVGLYQLNYRDQKAEFGIVIGFPEFRDGGNGTEITKHVLDYGFNELNLNKITLTVNEDNERAKAVYTKIGFVKEGVSREDVWKAGHFIDVAQMSLLRREWLSIST